MLKSKNFKYDLNKCKIIKELGHGMFGTTYLVELNSKKYALKIEKITEFNVFQKFNTKYQEWREIIFSEKFGNKYPEQFIKLYTWDIINNCEYNNPNNPNDLIYLPKEVQQTLKDKSNSKYCIRKLYSLVDTDLSKIIKNLNKKQIYSLIIQLAHIIWLLKTKGYSHNDLHGQNIGVINTKKKYINIFHNKIPISIPTYGYIFVALDYGNLTKNSWELTEYEKNFVNNDIMKILKKLIKYQDKFIIGKRQINKLLKIKDIEDDLMILITKMPEWKNIDEYILNLDFNDKLILLQILYPEVFQQLLLEDKFKKINNLVYLIDLEDILYFMKNKSNLKKIIKYFITKIYNI